ncbi:3-phenylpropionate/cinnamic acid dioxygenase subunit beta [Paralimibaculum aggregatum]|uniref:3-phenylpropionate/cinnamic acid dioxygenase subunit beta n=1 Tax=Paralimibaculum aggregatum TaxID=3036245 RepID=A0ABQ6LSH5_9RHOB|nr:aromatic-ring-hydroxylating dioxygenase subunit beta [Limibaculum sp. NKW23]GMG85021.1 3-phenylpropionate/cinnamic acid dioxygenase subunit beta [Limibaculum sp. NKW23]
MTLDTIEDPRLLHYEIEQFYFAEAELLEAGRYEDWIEATFTEDIHYWMPVRETHNDRALGVRGEGDLAIYDDDRTFLAARAERFRSALAHAELPPSRLRYFVTNLRIEPAGEGLATRCNLLVNQTRLGRLEHQYVGERQDAFRRTDAGWRIHRRQVILDHTTLPRSLTVFF